MNQLLKILLDHPDKTERFFIWFLQSAIIIGGMSYFFGYNIVQIKSENGTLEFNVIGQLSALRLATYFLVFTISWIIIWGVVADLIIQSLFHLLNWIFRQIRNFLLELYLVIVKKNLAIFSFFKIIQKRKLDRDLANYDEDLKYQPNEFIVKTQKLNKDFEFFFELNKWTKSTLGSEILLEIISFEKRDFIHSRMIRYYTIIVIILFLKFNYLEFYKYLIFSIIIFFIGCIVFGIKNLSNKLNQRELFYLIPRLKFEVYYEFVKGCIESSKIAGDYEIITKSKFLTLNLKNNENEIRRDFFKSINIIPLDDKINPLILSINRFKEFRSLTIFISEFIPTIDICKSIELNQQCLLVVQNQEDLLDGILKLYPIITGQVKLKKT